MTIAELPSDAVQQMFEYWKALMGYKRARLTSERRKAIRGRLNDGYTLEDIQLAIEGCYLSPFNHEGANDRDTRYDDIELICRNGVKLDRFIRIREDAEERWRRVQEERSAQQDKHALPVVDQTSPEAIAAHKNFLAQIAKCMPKFKPTGPRVH